MEETQEVCDLCNEYTGSSAQVRGHKYHCQKSGKSADAEQEPPSDKIQEPEKPQTEKWQKRERPNRKARVPFGAPQRKLNCPDGDGFHYRVFNDNWRKEPGRVKRAKDAGYEPVEGYQQVPVGTNEDGSAIKGVLMKIPQELYEEDQKLKRKEIDKVDQAIKGGTLEQQAGDKRYTPQGIKIWANNNENA